MAEPIQHITFIDDPEDVRKFDKNMKNPKVTKEKVTFFREAIRVFKMHPF